MKILILNWRDVTHPKSGGAELVTMEHAKWWVKFGNDVTWLTSGYNTAKSEEIIGGVKILRRSGSALIYPWAFFYVLFNSKKYDVIVDEVHALPFLTPLASRVPSVAFIHEVAGEIWNIMAPFPFNIIGPYLEKIFFSFYTRTLFWTDAPSTINELEKIGIPRKNCIAIPCPVNVPILHNKQWQKNRVPSFLFVSRLVPMKGIESVLRAFSSIKKDLPEAKLDILGGGEPGYIESLKRIIATLNCDDSIFFHGKVSEKEKLEYMGKSHILLHASLKEGWGLVVLEAAAQGTPSVVYNVPGLCDVVKNQRTGIVLNKNTPEQLAKESVALLKNKEQYETFQKNGKEWVQSLKWDEVTRQSLSILTQAIHNTEI